MKKWLTPFIALLGIASLPSLAPTGDLFWIGAAQADSPQNPAQEKQILLQKAANSAAAIILADSRAATSYLEVAINNVGGFTCGIPAGASLLFGHPTPITSGTTIQVDGTNYWNYKGRSFGTVVVAPYDVDAVTSEGAWNIANGKIKLTENLQIINGDSGNTDTLKITHTAFNQDSVAHNVGMRVMLDTFLGTTDGVPFRVASGEITQETELTGEDVPLYWTVFENLTDPNSPKAQGTMITDDGTIPDKVVFAADALRMLSHPWNFVVDPSVTILDGDSAVGVYWNPVTVAPGESLTRTTFYGLSGMTIDGNVALDVPASLAVEDNCIYVPNPFPVTAYVTNDGTLAMSGVTATLTLPAGLTLESGSLTQTIGSIAVGNSQQVSWSVNATGTTTGMLTLSALIRGTNMPAKTVSETIDVPGCVMGTTTTLNAVPNPADYGQDVKLNAVVAAVSGTAVPTGNVTFNVDGNVVATQALAAGATSYVASGLTAGVHSASANYAGEGTFSSSSAGPITVTIIPPVVVSDTTTTLAATPNPGTVGQPVTIKATVTASNGAVPTGSVTFNVDNSPVPSVTLDASGIATYVANGLAAGAHTATANYAGVTGSFNPSSAGPINFSVTEPPLTNLPVAVTNPATAVVLTSATLNGKVTPNGGATTVSFDFGYNEAYGFTVNATPSSIPGSALGTIVSASKTGLDQCTDYAYRTVATNSAGTVYGEKRTFKTTCDDITKNADAWLYKPNPIVLVGKEFTQDIHINTHGGVVAAYELIVNFDNSKMFVDTMYQNTAGTCDQGVCPGTGALSGAFVTTDNSAGTIMLAGFDANGTGPSNDLQLVQIHFLARNAPGVYPVDLTVNDLSDQFGDSVGNLQSRGSHIAISYGLCGDSDGTGVVNIVDALSIARKSVGLPPPPTINLSLADVNRDNRVVATDAMHIARYSVGLQIGAVNACAIGMPLPPLAQ